MECSIYFGTHRTSNVQLFIRPASAGEDGLPSKWHLPFPLNSFVAFFFFFVCFLGLFL
jgi:hypothetical protein